MSSTPAKRVAAFQTDYLTVWREAAPLFERDEDGERDWSAFDRWRELTAGLDERHALPGTSLGLGNSFSGQPEYDPAAESVTTATEDGDRALVQTTRDGGFGIRFREYELARRDGDWRIDRIGDYFEDPSGPFCPPARLAELTAGVGPATPVRPLPAAESRIDVGALFVERDVVDADGEVSRIEVRPAGSVLSPSGVLTVVDFGYDAAQLHALERAVPPGRYAVDNAVAFGRTAALRVTVAPGDPVSWHPACDAQGGYVHGVDAGNLGVFDLPAYAAVSIRDKERTYDRWAMRFEPGRAHLLDFGGGQPIGVVCDSGWGDGAYPAYWGADAEGGTVQLVLDFLVLSRAVEEEVSLPWADGPLPSATLADLGITLATQTRRKLLTSTSWLLVSDPQEHVLAVEVRDATGRPVEGVEPEAGPGSGGEGPRTVRHRVPGKPGPGWAVHVTADGGRALL